MVFLEIKSKNRIIESVELNPHSFLCTISKIPKINNCTKYRMVVYFKEHNEIYFINNKIYVEYCWVNLNSLYLRRKNDGKQKNQQLR
ncbi:hypothetical protein CD156_04085 [Staphylococcus capitis subsp. urealyticus]|nr:hypothetical protein CD156_04085 [Staphylococcus capitis subsp. urealyticus]